MENPRPKVAKIIRDIRNLFRLKKELNYTAIKDIRNLFRRKKETKVTKDKMLRDIKNPFDPFFLLLSRLLGAGSSFLKVAGSPTEVHNTDPAHLFV